MRNFEYSRARSIDEALQQHGNGQASEYLAGGTTLIDLVKLEVMQPARLVDVNRLDLAKIDALPDGGFRIGAMVRNSDLAHDERIRQAYPVLAEALLTGASPQLRNMATTGGNLLQRTRCQYFRDNFSPCNKRQPGSGCAAIDGYNRSHAVLGTSDACIATHPSDMCVALAALEAKIEVRGGNGTRTIAIEDFHLLPGDSPQREFALRSDELITSVLLAPPPAGVRSWYLKARDRASFEFALASAAVVLVLDGNRIASARIALGGVGTKPWRAREAEAQLMGTEARAENFQKAAAAALADARPREHNAFKIELAKRVLVQALQSVAAGQPPVRTT